MGNREWAVSRPLFLTSCLLSLASRFPGLLPLATGLLSRHNGPATPAL